MFKRACAVVLLALAANLPVAATSQRATDDAAALRRQGLQLGYNLDHAEALAAFKASIAADPTHPAGYRMAAAAAWIMILFEQGHISVDDYFGDTRIYQPRGVLNATLEAEFDTNIRQAIALAEAQVREHPDSADAHSQLGAAYGLQASFGTTVRGQVIASLGPARRAYREQERVMELEPSRTDAGITLGMYRYAVAGLPAPKRIVARLFGFPGDRPLAIRLLEAAAARPGDTQPNAMFTLILMYNGELRYDEAMALILELERRFPRNRLMPLEEGRTLLRQHKFAAAKSALTRGLAAFAADRRVKAPGEESRWRLARGAALVGLGECDEATRELNAALPLATRDWVRGRVQTELGKVADLRGDRPQALRAYRQAAQLCKQDHDVECADDAARLMKAVYR